jgi:hypothetical protein
MRYRTGLTFCGDPSGDLGLDCPTDEDYRSRAAFLSLRGAWACRETVLSLVRLGDY